MKYSILLLVALCFQDRFPPPPPAPPGYPQPTIYYDIEYDRFKDESKVRTPPLWIRGSYPMGVQLFFICRHPGRHPSLKKSFSMHIVSVSKEPMFRNDRDLNFMINDKRVPIGEMPLVSSNYVPGGDAYVEGMGMPTGLELLKQLASGLKVEGKIGPVEFNLTEHQKETIQKFIEYFEPKK
jgi:hypothetical protein